MLFNGQLGSKNESAPNYLPHLGYIGNQELKVPNYLFGSQTAGYAHCRELVDLVVNRSVEDQHKRNQALTDFLRKREMTFSKLTKSGEYRIFNVPCTTTPLPLPKSLFDSVERSAQVLVASLRLVLQDIYGSQSVRKSAFVQSLPTDTRQSFVNAVEKSPQYFPQLHDPVMRAYPFFDVVGLDLVLTEDLTDLSGPGPRLVARDLPFRLLEINAGSPSGASNNQHILEGLTKLDPESLGRIGKVMPNDHFEVLGATYRSLGETWTGVRDGVQIILPPGGESGAAPEIHQLATYSGLIYADAGQLYRDSAGAIRLRTVGGNDPVVTAIYSRVNSDSALFDLGRKLILRDAESGKALYSTDPLDFNKKNPKPLRDANGQPIPLESNYTIPGAIEAILDRKLYVGGLNRVLDNKIILAALCHHAPRFFKAELKSLGIDPDQTLPLSPPETLPSVADSIAIIEASPEDWVIKSPNLSGGKGVYILKTLSPAERKEIIEKARSNPKDFAYQRLVRIGRIPIAKRGSKVGTKGGAHDFHYANIAADIRMWSFFGAGTSAPTPRLTHNGLIRTAPYEKGPLSSIVNTSKGGGYAPLVIVDDMGHPNAVEVAQLGQRRTPVASTSDLPTFAGAQIVQVAQMVSHLRERLQRGTIETLDAYALATALKKQCREILSFLHPTNMESVNEIIESLERHLSKTKVRLYFERRSKLRVQVASSVHALEGALPIEFFELLDTFRTLNVSGEEVNSLNEKDRALDRVTLTALKKLAAAQVRLWPAEQAKLFQALGQLVELRFPANVLTSQSCQALLFKLECFALLAQEHLASRAGNRAFADLFAKSAKLAEPEFNILFAEESPRKGAERSLIATEEEFRTGQLLTESAFISPELRQARIDWMNAQASLAGASPEAVEAARAAHFAKHPVLIEHQRLVDQKSSSDPQAILTMLEVLPYAKYNLLQYARAQGISVRDLFHSKLVDRRVALLSSEQRVAQGLGAQAFAGECFARKRKAHGLFSDSDVYIWTSTEQSPLVQAYTVGHELIHFHQIRAMMEREQAALKTSPVEFARFLNFYGNFLGLASGTLEALSADATLERKPVYGFADLTWLARGKNWVHELKNSLKTSGSGEGWNALATRLGSSIGYSTDAAVQVQVKAVREVIPALENAKNLMFAQELGLRIPLEAVRSALPAANEAQRARYAPAVLRQARLAKPDGEALRLIASHQYHGVRFTKRRGDQEPLRLRAPLIAIALGGSYNQTQQQQQ